jgi:hypothetical protein
VIGRAFVTQWSPRLGVRAAKAYAAAMRSIAAAAFVGLAAVFVLTAGYHVAAVREVGWSLMACSALLFLSGVACFHRFYRSLSERLGTLVSFGNSPPLVEGKFEAWCQRRGVGVQWPARRP